MQYAKANWCKQNARDIQDSALDPDGEQTTRLAVQKGSLPRPTAAEPHLPFPDF